MLDKKHKSERIIKNSVQCLECNMILVSKNRHDFQSCNCPNQAFVDGGKEYLRRGAKDFTKVKDLSEIIYEDVGCEYYSWDKEKKDCWRCRLEK